ncbi:MAG: hypothetical protein HC922_00790 [Leptolyngbyaceae cyanobacterium SM2_3_12]|nr:hypothetical protein [Leptolyngbyaceae cyanobacterium SM2_3_12]
MKRLYLGYLQRLNGSFSAPDRTVPAAEVTSTRLVVKLISAQVKGTSAQDGAELANKWVNDRAKAKGETRRISMV